MVTARLLSFTTLVAMVMGACAVSLAEEVKDSATSTEIVSVEDSDLRNEDALRVAVGDFDDVEFLLRAEEMEAIADNVYISFNGVSTQGGGVSGSSSSSAEASGRVETTENSSTTFSGALALASATSEMVTVRQSSVAMSLSSDNSTEQYAVELQSLDKGRDGVGTLISSGDSGVSKETGATSFLGNSNSGGDGGGSYGISTLSNGGDIKPFATTYYYTWNGTEDANKWNTSSTNKNWNSSTSSSSSGSTDYWYNTSGSYPSDAIFDGTGYSTVIVDAGIEAANLTVTGGGEYTFEYNEGASLKASGNVMIGNSSGSGSLTINGGPNTFTGAIYVGYGNTGLLTITDGLNTFGADNTYIYIGEHATTSGSTPGTGTLKITGGNNTFSAGNIYLGASDGDKGTLEITGGTVNFELSVGADYTNVPATIYVGMNGTGEIIIGSLDDTGEGPNVTFTTGVANGTNLYLGYNSNSTGKITINSGTTTFEESVTLRVGEGTKTTGTIEINGGTTTFNTAVYLGYGAGSTGTLSINGGENTFNKDVYVGYVGNSSSTAGDTTGLLTISDGTNTFDAIYVGVADGNNRANGTMTVTGGDTTVDTLSISNGYTTTVSGGKLVVNNLVQKGNSGLYISGDGAVEIKTSTSGASGSGIYASGSGKLILDVAVTGGEGSTGSDLTISFTDSSTLVIQGGLLESILNAGEGEYTDVLQAETIYFGEEYVSMYTGNVSGLDNLINPYVDAGGYTLTWQYDETTHILSAAIAIATPEPSMFGLFAGLGAIALTATRRRRRKAA